MTIQNLVIFLLFLATLNYASTSWSSRSASFKQLERLVQERRKDKFIESLLARAHHVEADANPDSDKSVSRAQCTTKLEERVDCYPDQNPTQANCLARGCCWQIVTSGYTHVPACFFPLDFPTYEFRNVQETPVGVTFDAVRTANVSFRPNNILQLRGEIRFYDGGISRLRLTDPTKNRYEVPIPLGLGSIARRDTWPTVKIGQRGNILLQGKSQRSTKVELMESAPIIYADQFIQATIKIDGDIVYGVGERHGNLALSTKAGWTMVPLWATDRGPGQYSDNPESGNLYGVHPFALIMNSTNGEASGFFALNSNAMEFIISPAPAITVRTIGGIIDFFFFTGDTSMSASGESPRAGPTYANTIVAQYWKLVHNGMPIHMPSYWALGFHLCRWGYNTDTKLDQVINRTIAMDMPYDTQWADIDYMIDKRDWTIGTAFSRLPAIVNRLHSIGMHFVPIKDPAISSTQPSGKYPPYDRGLQMDVFVKLNGINLVGEVWPGLTVFPDYSKTATSEWWYMDARDFYNNQVKYDGLWIDMNEPASFKDGSLWNCTNSSLDDPPYKPPMLDLGYRKLWHKTLCPSAQQNISTHYNIHSLYGYHMTLATNSALKRVRPGERPFVLSRSSFAGSGAYGFHWTGDITSSWEHFRLSIPTVLMFEFFGIPFTGEDICGFFRNTTEELCIRWHQLGAFHPFMRNHNTIDATEQDPGVWSAFAKAAIVDVTRMRYTLLPYMYTLFYWAVANREMPTRPLFMLAPNDPATHSIDSQFTWGDGLVISPILNQGASSRSVYLPRVSSANATNTTATVYYSISLSGANETTCGAQYIGGAFHTISAPLNKYILHAKGGTIIPTQKYAQTTFHARQNPFSLLVPLTKESKVTSPGFAGNARGNLYLDDGISQDALRGNYSLINFVATESTISSILSKQGYIPDVHGAARKESSALTRVLMCGVQKAPANITVDGRPGTNAFAYISAFQMLEILDLKLKVTEAFVIRINY